MGINNVILKITPQKVFLTFALIFGIALVFISAPFEAPDEFNHFYRAFELSQFEILSIKVDNVIGNYLPKDIILMTEDLVDDIPFHKDKKIKLNKLKKYINKKTNYNDLQFASFPNTALYSPVVYIPQVIGITLAKFINITPLLTIYLGRLFSLVTFIALTYCAIKLTPICKWVFCLLGLMPMTLFLAASFSADTMCISLSFLLIAYILNCAFCEKDNIGKKEISIIMLLSILLALCKHAYFFLIFLFLIISTDKFKSKKQFAKIFLTILISSAFVSFLWGHSVNHMYIPLAAGVNPTEQMKCIIYHPQHFIHGMLISFVNFKVLRSFIGTLGWLDYQLPAVLICIYLFLLGFCAIFDNSKNVLLSLKQKLIMFVIAILNLSLVNFLMYLSMAPVGYDYIVGIQGRYLIPGAALFLLILSNKYTNKLNFLNKGGNIILALYLFIMLSVALILTIKRYYIY